MHKRILHLIHTPRHSGAETVVRDISMLHQSGGIESAVASFHPCEPAFAEQQKKMEKAGIRLFIPDSDLKGLARSRFFASVYRDFVPGVVYGHSVLPALYGRLALPFMGERPLFVTVLHSATNDDYAGMKLWASELVMARRGDRVFAVSREGAANYKRRIPWHRPVDVVPNGSDLVKIREAAKLREDHRARLGLSPEQKIILQIGRISPVKQQVFSLRALTELLKSRPRVQFWCAGLTQNADYEAKLRMAVEENNLQSQVRLLGSRDDIPGLLSAADVYIMPSLEEAHSLALIEALASGAPVVASAIAQFEYAGLLPGVALVSANDATEFASAVERFLQSGGRFERELYKLDICDVAATYASHVASR